MKKFISLSLCALASAAILAGCDSMPACDSKEVTKSFIKTMIDNYWGSERNFESYKNQMESAKWLDAKVYKSEKDINYCEAHVSSIYNNKETKNCIRYSVSKTKEGINVEIIENCDK